MLHIISCEEAVHVHWKWGRLESREALYVAQHCSYKFSVSVFQSLQVLLQTNDWSHCTLSCCACECDCSIGPVENCVRPENIQFETASAPNILVQAGEGISSQSGICKCWTVALSSSFPLYYVVWGGLVDELMWNFLPCLATCVVQWFISWAWLL